MKGLSKKLDPFTTYFYKAQTSLAPLHKDKMM